MRIRLDHAGMAEMLKSEPVAAAVRDLAEQVAAELVTPDDVEPLVDSYTTDRAATAVTVPHAAALAYQAKYGMMTRAAAAVGLEVRERE